VIVLVLNAMPWDIRSTVKLSKADTFDAFAMADVFAYPSVLSGGKGMGTSGVSNDRICQVVCLFLAHNFNFPGRARMA
jgi:hypothetical protein